MSPICGGALIMSFVKGVLLLAEFGETSIRAPSIPHN